MSEVAGGVKVLDVATRIAEEVLFPAALQVESADAVPASHLDELAAAGLYGLVGPAEISGLDVPDLATMCRVTEILAGGCLSTTFVWSQHHSAVRGTMNSSNAAVREEWLAPLCTGRRRAGVAIGSAVRPGPPALRATAVDGGFRFDGEALWVTGWGLIDTLYAAGRDEQDMLVFALLDAQESESVSARLLDMVAIRSTRTGQVHFDSHFVPTERVAAIVPHAMWRERDATNLRFNGSFALGVAGRCLRLIGPSPLDEELTAVRAELDSAAPQAMPAARAAAAEFALRAAAYFAASQGSRSVLLDQHAQRLLREAMFLLVFGSRPTIRAALLHRLSGRRG